MSRSGTLGLVFAAILAIPGAPVAGAATPDLVEVVEGFEKPQIADESAPVSNLKLTSGPFECALTAGRAAFVKAGWEVVGHLLRRKRHDGVRVDGADRIAGRRRTSRRSPRA